MWDRAVLLDAKEHGPEPELPGLVIPHDTWELIDHEARNWRSEMRKIHASGRPYAMPNQPWRSLPNYNNQEPPIVNQTEVASTEEKLLWDPAGKAPQTAIPANGLYADALLEVTAWGIMTSVAEASKTLNLKPRFGTTTAGTLLGESGAYTVVNAAKTNVNWRLEMIVHCRLIGATGTVTCSGCFSCITVATPINFGTASASATEINTTTASGLLVTATNSTASNKQTCLGVVVESLN